MSRPLPPLNALRAFEAAGRHLSVSQAAEELHVTPAAVSHQIKALEERLGVALLERRHRSVRLTEAGQAALPLLSDGFDSLAEAIERLRARARANIVTVSVTPAFAAKWLVPRLDRFSRTMPDVDVRILATMNVVDLDHGEADLSVRFGSGVYPRLRSVQLFEESLILVCAPVLANGLAPPSRLEEVEGHVLLHSDTMSFSAGGPEWAMWLKAAGVDHIDASRGPRFNATELAIQAAVEGAGLLMTARSLVQDDIEAGRLIEPFAVSLPVAMAYHLVCTDRALVRPEVEGFRDWMIAEAGAGPG